MYGLSRAPGLPAFRHVCLVGAHQDRYVPWHSARAQHAPGADGYVREMARNLLSRLDPARNDVRRLDVSFRFARASLDTMTGRAAHVQFLDDPLLSLVFALVYRHLFD